MLEKNVQRRIAIKITAAAQYGFVAFVVKRRAKSETEIVALHAPAGKGACRFLDVLLGVPAALAGLAQGEQLHHLARKIFVGRFFAAVGTVQVHQHGGVFGHGMKQIAKIAERLRT